MQLMVKSLSMNQICSQERYLSAWMISTMTQISLIRVCNIASIFWEILKVIYKKLFTNQHSEY